MGSFKGHVLPGSLFLLVGLWHVGNSIVKYAANPNSHKVRTWHPVPGISGNLKYLEIYIIIIGSFVDMCIEFFYSPHLRIVVNGTLNPSHMNDFEHAGMLLMFFIFGVALLVSEKTRVAVVRSPMEPLCRLRLHNLWKQILLGVILQQVLCDPAVRISQQQLLGGIWNPPSGNARYLPLPNGALQLIAAVAFCAEYLLFSFHSTSHTGLEGRYHQILVVLVGLCIVSAVLGAAFTSSFVVDVLSGIAITLQGVWFYQTAFTLYGPMIPNGCNLKRNEVVCQSREFEMRGQFLANFQLSIIVLFLLALVMVFLGFAAVCCGPPTRYGYSSESRSTKFNQKGLALHT